MIIIVAPYTGYNSNGHVDLGASKKIRFVVSILSKLSGDIVLVNSAHNSSEKSSFKQRKIQIDGTTVLEIIPPTLEKKSIGKLLNLSQVDKTLDIIGELTKESRPKLFWFYNAYAFEMIFARKASRRFAAPQVLEFEDWHFSRNRGLNIKPYIDYFFWRRTVRSFARIYAINATVKSIVEPFCDDVQLLPGVVPNELCELNDSNPPFTTNTNINIGYFGGLKAEKGADIVLALAQALPQKFTVHVTGAGPLADEFTALSNSAESILKYHGMVDDKTLVSIIAKCDIILNPHVPMNQFSEGLFPFKVIEAIASGRLLISTDVSFNGFEDLAKAVVFVEHDSKKFAEAIEQSEKLYFQKVSQIKSSTHMALNLFGADSIMESLKKLVLDQNN
jgi:glycosyltransferase involved in cell wall biosynthesis